MREPSPFPSFPSSRGIGSIFIFFPSSLSHSSSSRYRSTARFSTPTAVALDPSNVLLFSPFTHSFMSPLSVDSSLSSSAMYALATRQSTSFVTNWKRFCARSIARALARWASSSASNNCEESGEGVGVRSLSAGGRVRNVRVCKR